MANPAALRPIAFFDSGLGGISVLRATRALMPNESYLYYGDSANAPYGVKPAAEICRLSEAVMQQVLRRGAKAVVVACNTATGVAIDQLRAQHPQVPIIGVEPAVKPAAERFPGGTILILATPQCLRSERFLQLQARFSSMANCIAVPCGGLMEFVERGELHSAALQQYLEEKLAPWKNTQVDAAVLGCTHYPFLRAAIQQALPGATVLDGNLGIALQLQRRLRQLGLLSPAAQPGCVTFLNSSEDPALLARSRMLLELPEQTDDEAPL